MAGQVKSDGLVLLAQLFGGQPDRGDGRAGRRQILAPAEQRCLAGGRLVLHRRRPGAQRIQSLQDPGAVVVQPVEGPGTGQHLQRPFAHPLHVHAAGKVVHVAERRIAAGLVDQFHGLHPHALERTQRIVDAALAHGKSGVGPVHAGGNDSNAHAVAFALVDRQLVGQVKIAVHHRRHELDRVVRLEPGRLVADDGIGRRMGLVEAVIGELFQKVEDLAGLLGIYPVGYCAVHELWPFLGHLAGDLLAHGAAQQVGAAQAVSRHDLRDLHHLFLIDDDALRFGQDVVDAGMDGFQRTEAVLDLAIGGDVLHRAGAIQRDQRHDVFDAGRPHPAQGVHHAAGFNLEHRDRAG